MAVMDLRRDLRRFSYRMLLSDSLANVTKGVNFKLFSGSIVYCIIEL